MSRRGAKDKEEANTSKPFRLELNVPSILEMRRTNVERRLLGHAMFEESEEAIRFIRELEGTPEQNQETLEKLERCAWHPDDRVVLELLGRKDIVQPNSSLVVEIYEAARSVASREKIVWTPVLDALSTSGLWPSPLHSTKRSAPQGEVAGQRYPVEWPSRILQGRVEKWIEAQENASDLHEFARFRAPDVAKKLGSYTGIFDDVLLERISEDPGAWAMFIGRTLLPKEALPAIWRIGERLISEGAESAGFFNGLQTFRALVERMKSPMPPEVARTLLAQVERAMESTELSEAHQENLWRAFDQFLVERADWNKAELDIFYRFGERARKDDLRAMAWSALAHSPSATPEIWLLLMKKARGGWVRRAIANVRGAREVPEIREKLVRSRDPEVLMHLLPELPPPDFAGAFALVAAKFPVFAANALERATPVQLSSLTNEHLLPLLQSTEATVRLKAIRAAGRRDESAPQAEDVAQDSAALSKESGRQGRVKL